jgi:hypothetical protein
VGKNERNKENTAVVKYNAGGEKLLAYKQKAYADNSWGGIQHPFYAGTCRLEVSGNLLAVYFGRMLFSGHQASYGFVLNKDTFERVDRGQVTNNNRTIEGPMVMPYVGHSLDQFLLPVENGFVFADQGDANHRCFTFAKFLPDTKTKTVNAFRFAGGHGQNETYAQMGGLAKTSSGFIFAGTYGKGAEKNARNLFVLTFDDNLTACGSPLYLTKYTIKEGHAAYPKIAPFGEGRFLLLWEQTGFNEWGFSTGYKTTWALVVNETGKVLSEARELPAVRLNMNDVLRYNHVTGKVYWAVNEGDNAIVIYSLGEAGDGADEE